MGKSKKGPIHSFTRAQAIADGALIDVSDRWGFDVPGYSEVALTRAAWARCVKMPKGVVGQDEHARLFNILDALKQELRSRSKRIIPFPIYVWGKGKKTTRIDLVALLSQGAVTVILADEA